MNPFLIWAMVTMLALAAELDWQLTASRET